MTRVLKHIFFGVRKNVKVNFAKGEFITGPRKVSEQKMKLGVIVKFIQTRANIPVCLQYWKLFAVLFRFGANLLYRRVLKNS